MDKRLHLGMDVGSVSLKTVLLDDEKNILFEDYTRLRGRPVETAIGVLRRMLGEFSPDEIASFSITGTGGERIGEALKGRFINEIIAQTKATEHFLPNTRTVIEMGGEDSKLSLLNPEDDSLRIDDFAMNTICAAGTGSFLDQQSNRLGLSIEEFGGVALRSEIPPRLAGRCTVFAKTDMIHLQQAATPDYDIIAGLCFAVARNLKSNIGRGKRIVGPVSFQGGVAANFGVRRAFKEILDLADDEFIVPEHFFTMGAIGAALTTMQEGAPDGYRFPGLGPLEELLATQKGAQTKPMPKLSPPDKPAKRVAEGTVSEANGVVEAYLGIDVGSISTKVVVIDTEMRVLTKQYLMTAGRPLDAVKEGLRGAGAEVGGKVKIVGAATTGSGRYLTADFVGADLVRNEITAQATASAAIDPDVDTIFEIGGQDSKYISLKNGAIVDFMMNKVCAAGTGSFLEEQAEKLGISIEEEFGDLALKAEAPARMGERCTVFIESDLVHHQQAGAKVEDLVAGLSYSIVYNYLNKVVEDRRVGDNIFYQGATAHNRGIVAGFEQVTGKKITVPEDCDVTGAIGAAILAMRERSWKESGFKGFELSEVEYKITTFECKECPNRCDVRRVKLEGEKRPLFYGSRCEKYERDKEKGRGAHLPDLFKERYDHLFTVLPEVEKVPAKRGQIGIPMALFFNELMPFFNNFFRALGYEVVVSDPTNKRLIHKGVESVVAEVCFPLKVSNGHVEDLLDKGVKKIFIPSIINMFKAGEKFKFNSICPYTKTFAYTIHSSLDFKSLGVEIVQPVLEFMFGKKELLRGLLTVKGQLGVGAGKIKRAFEFAWRAQEEFYEHLKARGQEIVENLGHDEKLMVVVGRPYNAFDPGVNLNLPKKLKDLGVLAMPMDFLDLDTASKDLEEPEKLYWKYAQKILGAAEYIKKDPRLFGIYISNFACGPDSFITHFFRDSLAGKPFLEIEIDEHSADAGAITRLEAFLDSLKHADIEPKPQPKGIRTMLETRETVFVPPMTDGGHGLAAAFRACGINAVMLPPSDQETLELGRKLSSGRECYPLTLTTGDMAKMVNRPDFDREKSVFFMPSGTGPCRFGQYHRYQRMVLDSLGYPDVPILSPNQDEKLWDDLGVAVDDEFTRLSWEGLVAIDILEKAKFETRPYEINRGQTDRVYQRWLEEVCTTVEAKGDVPAVMEAAVRDFRAIPTEQKGTRPLVGVVGEIYIRSNVFSNEDLIRTIERLGGEAWLPPIGEWLMYINYISARRARRYRDYGQAFKLWLTQRSQLKIEHALAAPFEGFVVNLHEPSIAQTIEYAGGFLDVSFEGEAILSVGKSRDFLLKGASGIINAMPFTCMPGTIVNALMKRFREINGNVPFLNMAYDGQEESGSLARLQAFMYQVRDYQERVNTEPRRPRGHH